jgi:POT family proton-dependent oligopeptide transporter
MADRYWGNRRSILLGGLIMALGQFCMFLSATFYTQIEISIFLMYAGLIFLIVGNGFFKPNITTMVGQLYHDNDIRKDSAYTIFYMGINLGAFFSPLVAGTLGDTGDPTDFKWGFFSACIGMLIGTVVFQILKNRYLVTPTGEAIGVKPNIQREPVRENLELQPSQSIGTLLKELTLWGMGEIAIFFLFYKVFFFDFFGSAIFSLCLIVPAYIITDRSLSKIEKHRIWVIYIISFCVIFFWSAFEQAGASLTFFADEQTDRVIFGWEMPASYFQVFNAFFIVLLAPVFSFLWIYLKRKKIEISSPAKQALGLFLLSIGYLIIALGVNNVEPGIKVSMLWLISLYFIHTIGELCLSPIGLSMVNRLAPVRFASLLMGVWFLSTSTANKFAGMLSALYPEFDSNGKLLKATSFAGFRIENLYDFFMLFVIMAGVASVLLFLFTKNLQKMMHEEEN